MTTRDTPNDRTATQNSRELERLLLSAAQASAMLGISKRLLWTLTNASRIPHVRIGRRVAYPVADLKAWVAARTIGGAS